MLQTKAFIQAVCQRTQAVSIKAGFGPKGGLWVCRKSQKVSTASDQYFMSYVKKLKGGGQIDPLPAGIGLNIDFQIILDQTTVLRIWLGMRHHLKLCLYYVNFRNKCTSDFLCEGI